MPRRGLPRRTTPAGAAERPVETIAVSSVLLVAELRSATSRQTRREVPQKAGLGLDQHDVRGGQVDMAKIHRNSALGNALKHLSINRVLPG
jgi:hypothetical protein